MLERSLACLPSPLIDWQIERALRFALGRRRHGRQLV